MSISTLLLDPGLLYVSFMFTVYSDTCLLAIIAGLHFMELNFPSAIDKNQHSPIGFDIIFPGIMLDYAIDLDLKLPLDPTVLNAMLRNRELELKRYHLFYICRFFLLVLLVQLEESACNYVHAMEFMTHIKWKGLTNRVETSTMLLKLRKLASIDDKNGTWKPGVKELE